MFKCSSLLFYLLFSSAYIMAQQTAFMDRKLPQPALIPYPAEIRMSQLPCFSWSAQTTLRSSKEFRNEQQLLLDLLKERFNIKLAHASFARPGNSIRFKYS